MWRMILEDFHLVGQEGFEIFRNGLHSKMVTRILGDPQCVGVLRLGIIRSDMNCTQKWPKGVQFHEKDP
jgi:hypothetical protein